MNNMKSSIWWCTVAVATCIRVLRKGHFLEADFSGINDPILRYLAVVPVDYFTQKGVHFSEGSCKCAMRIFACEDISIYAGSRTWLSAGSAYYLEKPVCGSGTVFRVSQAASHALPALPCLVTVTVTVTLTHPFQIIVILNTHLLSLGRTAARTCGRHVNDIQSIPLLSGVCV